MMGCHRPERRQHFYPSPAEPFGGPAEIQGHHHPGRCELELKHFGTDGLVRPLGLWELVPYNLHYTEKISTLKTTDKKQPRNFSLTSIIQGLKGSDVAEQT